VKAANFTRLLVCLICVVDHATRMGWGDPLHLRIWARRESESGLELLGAGGFVQPEMEGGT
jgi:hypothetical protein